MTFEEFTNAAAPAGWPPPLEALWHEQRGDWERAHQAAQADHGAAAAWVHAYLHRVEGDEGNAAYWYRRAGKSLPPAGTAWAEERAAIARALLADPVRGS
ncbi:hypothetical protein K0B96_05370 [Horticoccus luteus]|uniref:Uncharacterized protein n=1 Tax=Horticoccus luteus TaxID=2862869 RepID=A0A8F9XI49_9BACT|nr:hypothetical protein [Horticoccus luteus]QYM80050.1 hypothetical protein K0B96_05370 [Horticoccus luteus]